MSKKKIFKFGGLGLIVIIILLLIANFVEGKIIEARKGQIKLSDCKNWVVFQDRQRNISQLLINCTVHLPLVGHFSYLPKPVGFYANQPGFLDSSAQPLWGKNAKYDAVINNPDVASGVTPRFFSWPGIKKINFLFYLPYKVSDSETFTFNTAFFIEGLTNPLSFTRYYFTCGNSCDQELLLYRATTKTLVTIETIQGSDFNNLIDLSKPGVTVKSSQKDFKLIDDDKNGKFEALILGMDVIVSEPGTYIAGIDIVADTRDPANPYKTYLIASDSRTLTLEEGATNLVSRFSGRDFVNKGYHGSYYNIFYAYKQGTKKPTNETFSSKRTSNVLYHPDGYVIRLSDFE